MSFFFNDTATTEIYTLSLHDALPISFNWFDLVVVVVLLFGLFRGRRNGMAKEILPLMQWLVLVPVCGLGYDIRSEEHTSELQSHVNLVCRLLLEKKKKK